MERQEFTDGLRRALAGKVEAEIIEDTIRYYEDYIDMQIRMGKSREEVMESLGKPALIAKSIVVANQSGRDIYENADEIYEEEGAAGGTAPRFSRSWLGEKGIRLIMQMPRWLVVLLSAVVVLLVLSVVVSVLSFLAPVLLLLLVPFVLAAVVKKS